MENRIVLMLILLAALPCCTTPAQTGDAGTLRITSPSFSEGGAIPKEHTCEGLDYSPELDVEGIPPGTKTLAIIVEDPDAIGKIWDHWLVWNLPPLDNLSAGSVPEGAVQGKNGAGNIGYTGPCPPPFTPHRYYFRIYALDTALDLPSGDSKRNLLYAMDGHVLDSAHLMGTFNRDDSITA